MSTNRCQVIPAAGGRQQVVLTASGRHQGVFPWPNRLRHLTGSVIQCHVSGDTMTGWKQRKKLPGRYHISKERRNRYGTWVSNEAAGEGRRPPLPQSGEGGCIPAACPLSILAAFLEISLVQVSFLLYNCVCITIYLLFSSHVPCNYLLIPCHMRCD
jgi:hypothetical protein